MQNRQPQSFLNDLAHKLLASPQEAALRGTRYNVPLINCLVLYVGMQVHAGPWCPCACATGCQKVDLMPFRKKRRPRSLSNILPVTVLLLKTSLSFWTVLVSFDSESSDRARSPS